MRYRLIHKKTKEYIAEAVDVGGTLHVHYSKSSASFQYEFGKWPSTKTYNYEEIVDKG